MTKSYACSGSTRSPEGVDLCRQRVLAIRRERDVRSPRKGTEELRRKIERDPQDPELLLTAWGVGYKFAERL